jgi:biopolymer transport protein ExbD
MEDPWLDQDESAGINITPLVDVGLVLVLIFMVTAPLAMINGIDVFSQVLKKYGLSTPQQNIFVRLTPKNILVKDVKGVEKPVAGADFEAVLQKMISQSEKKNVYIKSDRMILHKVTVSAMDAAKRAGAKDVVLVES